MNDAIVCGRRIGFFNGWDEIDDGHFQLYDFKSEIPAINNCKTLCVDYNDGKFYTTDDVGNVDWHTDLVIALRDIPRM